VKLRAAALAVGNGVVVGCAGLLAGWLLWRRAAAGELDPYDSGVYWEGALVAALLLGLVSGHVSGIFTAAVGLVLPLHPRRAREAEPLLRRLRQRLARLPRAEGRPARRQGREGVAAADEQTP
jgi:hypothetical protein